MTGTQYAGWMSGNAPRQTRRRLPRALVRSVLTVVTVLVGTLGGLGWMYALRSDGLLGVGPRVDDSLPLLQLAAADAQPLARVIVSWLAAGLVGGLVLYRVRRIQRVLTAGILSTLLLAIDAQASYALTRNLRFTQILWTHAPSLGPWLGAGLFTIACGLPGPLRRRREIVIRPPGEGASPGPARFRSAPPRAAGRS